MAWDWVAEGAYPVAQPVNPPAGQSRPPRGSGPVSEQYVIDGLVARGMPRTAAIGFAANFSAESNLNPGINEIAPVVPGSRGGFGFAQWTGPRRRQLEAYANDRGTSVDDPDMQLDFLMQELNTTEAGSRDAIYGATDPRQAAFTVMDRFLRPGVANGGHRMSEAERIAGMAGGSTTPGGTPPGNVLAGLIPPVPGAISGGANALAPPAAQQPPQFMPNALDPAAFMRQRTRPQLAGFGPGQSPFIGA